MPVASLKVAACAILLATIGVPMVARAQIVRYEALANSRMAAGRPTPDTATLLTDELLFERATQTYLWAFPLINTLGMKVGSERSFGAGYNVLPVWKERLDAKTLVTTPNSDVLYAMSYIDVGKDGPMVFEAPPGLQGILLDFWQRPISGPTIGGHAYFGDVGFFGPDDGKGGKFLILPPGFDKPVPDGYFVYRSGTNNVFVFLRAFYQDPANLKPAVALMERAKFYPLGGAADAKPMQYPDASGVAVNMLPTSDGGAFDELKSLVDSEGDSLMDGDWRGMLASIGIVKGEPFAPDAHRRAILDLAAKTAYRMSRVISVEDNVGGRSYLVYPDRHWLNPLADGTPANPSGALDLAWNRTAGRYLDLDARIWFFTDYYSISPGMISQTPGKGAKYMIAFTDSSGVPLSGDASYHVRLPPNVPAANFWSVTLYDAANASGLANGQPFPSLGSRDKPAQNADGSTDLYLGPKAPDGKAGNWLATVPGKGYFAILRLYSPTEPAIDKSWKPGDIEKVTEPGAGQTASGSETATAAASPLQAAETAQGPAPLQPAPPANNAMPRGPDTRSTITADYAKTVARNAYFWAWPMMNLQSRLETFRPLKQAALGGGVLPIGPVNEVTMLTDYIEPSERAVACPNQDVVYGQAVLDLAKEPVVVQVPDFGGRFFVYQVVDQRTDSFADVGSMYATQPGFYLLAGPDWHGAVPKGIAKVFRSPTNVGFLVPRVFRADTDADKEAVQSVIDQIMSYPLSRYSGEMQARDWSQLPKLGGGDTGDTEVRWVKPENFLTALPAVLNNVPPLPGEEAFYAQMRAVLDAAQHDPAVKDAVNEAAAEADSQLVAPLFEFRNYGLPLPDHWTTQDNGAAFGTDYFMRTAVAKSNIFVNKPNETKYFYQDFDAAGNRLNGANRYTVTFDQGETPPVNGFWSLTLYNQHHFFAPNAIKRYSVGTKNQDLKYNPDGSLTIYVQADPPAEAQRSNWLPAPNADFSLYMRAYWPKVAVTDGSWTPPSVERVEISTGSSTPPTAGSK